MEIYRGLRWPMFGVILPGIMAIVLLVLGGCEKPEVKVVPPPVEVIASEVVPRTVPVEMTFVAQVESSHQVEIVARVNGFLDKILYREGEMVKQGQTMFLMDQKPFLAQVNATRAELDNRKAQLWTAQANLDRIKPLTAQDAASKSDLDNAIGAVQSAEAGVNQARARLDQAELDLGYTVIKSPVTGVSGEALVREGTYLSMGPGGHLSYVAQLDPIWVTFSISQNQMSQGQQEIAAGRVIPPIDQNYVIEIELSDGSRYPHTGKLNFVSSVFSQETGTFLVRAELPNPEGVLRPGMFVKARVKGAMHPDALVVPQKAVQQTSNGHVVFIVSSSETAEVRPVIVGEWVGSDWVINQGLKAGEQVIVDGFQRLRPETPVKVVAAPATVTEPVAAPPAK